MDSLIMSKDDISWYRYACLLMRRYILELVYNSPNDGHLGGSLSLVEILAALLLGPYKAMKFDPDIPDDPQRDLLVLSKGHASAALYSAFYLAGFISRDQLRTYRHNFSELQGHPHLGDLPWIDYSGGILGGGLSFANGYVFASGQFTPVNVYCILGDGECNEGQIWEAMQTLQQLVSVRQVFKLCIIVDWNRAQLDGPTAAIKDLDLFSMFKNFGLITVEIDGHSISELLNAFQVFGAGDVPMIIIANTVKGKGVKSWEGQGWKVHGGIPKDLTLEQALAELAEGAHHE